MNGDALKDLVKQGLQAQKSATQLGDDAAAEISTDATNPDLKAFLQQGSEAAKKWETQITASLKIMGVEDSPIDNPISKAQYEVSKRIRAEADTPESRDLGIIASGQLVMHYYIAGFGTLAAYAEKLGDTQVSSIVGNLLSEAKQADQAMTALAQKILTA